MLSYVRRCPLEENGYLKAIATWPPDIEVASANFVDFFAFRRYPIILLLPFTCDARHALLLFPNKYVPGGVC